jgi:ketosteroid isomerase-like protein
MATRRFEPSDRTAITAVIEGQSAAWNRGDLAGYFDGYAKIEGLVFTSGGTVTHGWQASFDRFQKKYATDKSGMGQLKFEILSIDPVGADGAIVLGSWHLTGSPHDGEGIFTLVMERRPEGWRVIHDHTSLKPPPP